MLWRAMTTHILKSDAMKRNKFSRFLLLSGRVVSAVFKIPTFIRLLSDRNNFRRIYGKTGTRINSRNFIRPTVSSGESWWIPSWTVLEHKRRKKIILTFYDYEQVLFLVPAVQTFFREESTFNVQRAESSSALSSSISKKLYSYILLVCESESRVDASRSWQSLTFRF